MDEQPSPTDDRETWVARLRALIGGLDVLVGVLLAAFLLPLVIGPFAMAFYECFKARDYTGVALAGGLFAGLVALTLRAVRRGGSWLSVLGAVIAVLALITFIATRLPR